MLPAWISSSQNMFWEHWYHWMLVLKIKKKKFAIKKKNWQSSAFYLSWDAKAHLLAKSSDKYCIKEKYLTYHKLAFWNIFDYWTPMFLVVGVILITSWKCCREPWLEFSEALGPDAHITGFFLEGAGHSVLIGAWHLHPGLVILTLFLSTWSPGMLQGLGQLVWAVSGHSIPAMVAGDE